MPPALDTLPPEILFNILSYCSPFDSSYNSRYTLYAIAGTSTYLNSIVEEYTRSLLKRHAGINPPKAWKTGAFICRRKWRRWINQACQLCSKASKRKAILDPALTCCQKCDKKHFPKITMTAALLKYRLSKLDVFTPNALHPSLPPLVVGSYICMGGDTIMIAMPSIVKRAAHIYDLLGDKSNDMDYLRRRVLAHQRLIQHMDIRLDVRNGRAKWLKANKLEDECGRPRGPKSMATKEGRVKYVREGLKKEWVALGVYVEGSSAETAIEVN